MCRYMEFPIRLNKYLAHTGVASRREADVLIATGKVLVNGAVAVMGQQVHESDTVTIAGKTKDKTYLAYYKGRGIITHSPSASETDIITKLKSSRLNLELAGVSPIGRLDKDSEGLILLSNDGRITGPLLDPEAAHEKEYDVIVDKPINNWFLKHMAAGVDIEGYQTKPTNITKHAKNPNRFSIVLTEGKKHQIRRMCAALGYQIETLKRTRIMNIELGLLKPNQHRKLTKDEQTALLRELGIS